MYDITGYMLKLLETRVGDSNGGGGGGGGITGLAQGWRDKEMRERERERIG